MAVEEAGTERSPPGEDEIVARIRDAVMEQRLRPGTKLTEAALCTAFGTGRMRARRVLLRLASDGIVELLTNRGAFVATPTAAEAREIFEARQAIEARIAELAALRASADELGRLRAHLAREAAAHDRGDRHATIRLTGEFHTLLADMAGNGVLAQAVRELVTRTSLILGIFGTPGTGSCREDDHVRMMSALEARDGAAAATLMREHLAGIEASLDLTLTASASVDVATLLASRAG